MVLLVQVVGEVMGVMGAEHPAGVPAQAVLQHAYEDEDGVGSQGKPSQVLACGHLILNYFNHFNHISPLSPHVPLELTSGYLDIDKDWFLVAGF